MYIDKTKDTTRMTDILAMDTAKLKTKIAMALNNPAIYKEFQNAESIWDYAAAAHLITWAEAKRQKEEAKQTEEEVVE